MVVAAMMPPPHNESVMLEFWHESEKGKFLVLFNCIDIDIDIDIVILFVFHKSKSKYNK
jgi:hypothetical protein